MPGPLVVSPVMDTVRPRTPSTTANMRGAVPGPNAKPRMPGRSRDAHSANSASAIRARPPQKSRGARMNDARSDAPPPLSDIYTPSLQRLSHVSRHAYALELSLAQGAARPKAFVAPPSPKSPSMDKACKAEGRGAGERDQRRNPRPGGERKSRRGDREGAPIVIGGACDNQRAGRN